MTLSTHEIEMRPAVNQGLVFACPKCGRDTIVWGWQERDKTWWAADVLKCSFHDCDYAFYGVERKGA